MIKKKKRKKKEKNRRKMKKIVEIKFEAARGERGVSIKTRKRKRGERKG